MLLLLMMLTLTGCPEKAPDEEDDPADINGPMVANEVQIRTGADSVEMQWLVPTLEQSIFNRDVRGFLLLRAESEQFLQPARLDEFETGDEFGDQTVAAVIDADPTRDQEIEVFFTDEGLETGKTYYYQLFTYDEVPNYSEPVRFEATPGSLVQPRLSHAQVLLADGRVLLSGGLGNEGPLDTAEIFDPETQTFRETVDTMRRRRFGHTMTLLEDGTVLVAGGYEEGLVDILDSVEVFDPVDETFTRLSARMNVGRALHTATRLSDGRVVFIGGTDGYNAYDTAEVFDPADGSITLVEDRMGVARFDHTATVLTDVNPTRILVAGGLRDEETAASATFLDSANFDFGRYVPEPGNEENALNTGRASHTASLLPDGRVLLVGGFSGTIAAGTPTASVEIFDPDTGAFETVAQLEHNRSGHVAAVLDDGRVLVAGGIDGDLNILGTSEIIDPVAKAVEPGPDMAVGRTVAEITQLDTGDWFITGGNRSGDFFLPLPVSSAEILDPAGDAFSLVP
ncbi:MAG: hypothetical protein H6683_10875 [Deltaproteobacteria bacterium]|nr:hypothetical protein [Deltaproteobacteria bacterium]